MEGALAGAGKGGESRACWAEGEGGGRHGQVHLEADVQGIWGPGYDWQAGWAGGGGRAVREGRRQPDGSSGGQCWLGFPRGREGQAPKVTGG